MARTEKELLSDAKDVARRNAITFLVIAAGLMLVWSTTLEEARREFRKSESALSANWIKAEKTRVIIKSLRRDRQAATEAIKEEQAKARQACAATQSAECRQSEARVAVAQRLHADIEKRLGEFGTIENDLTQSIRQIRTRLEQKVSFDVGQGIRLPFTLLFAPLGWLAVLTFLLLRVGTARGQFWRLASQAEIRSRLDGARIPDNGLIDIPFWAGPVPQARGRHGEETALQRIVGWQRDARTKRLLLWAILALGALVCLRVCWIGVYFENVALLPDQILARLGRLPQDYVAPGWLDRLLGPAIAAMAILNLLLFAWLALPGRRTSRVPAPIPVDIGRRELVAIGVGAAGFSLLAYQLYVSMVTANRGRLVASLYKRMLFYRKRNNKAHHVAAPKLAPGWYFNGGRVHRVTADHVIRNARGLKLDKLRPVSFDVDDMDLDTPGLFTRKEYELRVREDVALYSLVEGKAWLALNYLLVEPFPTVERAGTDLRALDLAAGISLWLDWAEGMARATDTAGQIARSTRSDWFRNQLEARIERWTGPSGEHWRGTRWSRDHPLRWSGRKILKSQLKPLELTWPDDQP